MNLDNKKPGRKPLYVYYIIAAVIIILLNVLLLPAIEGRKVQTTDYSTFLTGVEKDYVKTVEIQDDYIYYVAESDGQEGYFRTVKMNDPDLVDRLHDANVKFGAAAPQQTSIWISLIAAPAIFFFSPVSGSITSTSSSAFFKNCSDSSQRYPVVPVAA